MHLTLVGSGGLRPVVETQVRRLLAPQTYTFVDHMPSGRLREYVNQSDLIVGIFGTSDKAAEVVANKVWQGLAAGKVVLTRESPALHDLAAIVDQQLQVIPAGSAALVTQSLIGLADNWPVDAAASSTVAESLERYVDAQYAATFAASGLSHRLTSFGA
jgi:hypothetical protein